METKQKPESQAGQEDGSFCRERHEGAGVDRIREDHTIRGMNRSPRW